MDRSPLPIRYPICRAIVTATAVDTIDQPSSGRATLAPVATMSAKLMAGSNENPETLAKHYSDQKCNNAKYCHGPAPTVVKVKRPANAEVPLGH